MLVFDEYSFSFNHKSLFTEFEIAVLVFKPRTSGITYLKIAKIFGVHEETIRKKINWVKKGDKEGMQNYFASRIKLGKLDYLAVVIRYPQFKDAIDEILINDGFQDLIV